MFRGEDGGPYLLRDRTRIPDEYGARTLATWDARGRNAGEVGGKWPEGIGQFASPTPEFGAEATEAGAVDAHWATARVYDYFRDKHGRDSLDGRGMGIDSLVGVTEFGEPYVNAFWDGQRRCTAAGTGSTGRSPRPWTSSATS